MDFLKDLHGLILTGGFSKRMGREKALISYHGIPQYQYLYQLLLPVCKKVFLSCRKEQASGFGAGFPCIFDLYEGIGPMNGVLSFFEKYPNEACLLIACDMPFADKDAISYLVKHRSPEKMATAYQSQEGLPEPLLCIWEAKSYPFLKKRFLSGNYSLRDVLKASDAQYLKPDNEKTLLNVNDEKTLDLVRTQLKIPPEKL